MQKFLTTFFIVLLVPVFAGAATLRLETSAIPIHAGDTFVVDLFLDTESDVLNALEGSINFSNNLALQDIRYGGSIVPMWVSKPAQTQIGMITFAGVIPGGYQGSGAGARGNVYTLVFEAKTTGAARVSFGPDTIVYKDDGNGTIAQLSTSPLSFTIFPAAISPHAIALPKDTTLPEPFTPLIVSGLPYGFSGSALVFSTQDKDSGVAHFNIAFSYNKDAKESDLSWQDAESPYEISSADVDKYIYVRAVDGAGNTRVAIVPPQKESIVRVLHEWGFVLALFVAFAAMLLWNRQRRRRS